MIHITIDETKHVTGVYSDEFPALIPSAAITLTDAEAPMILNADRFGDFIYTDGGLRMDSAAIAAIELNQAQFKQIAAIEAAYTAANEAPITYAGHTFQADAASVALMAQVASALPAGASIGWYDIDNIEVPLTDVQFAELRRAILTRGQPLFAKKQTLKDAIRAATTVAEVEAVTW